jgi:hypothetical protein
MANLPAASGERTTDRLVEITEYRDALYGANVVGPKDLIAIRVDALDWLIAEVEQWRQAAGAEANLADERGRDLAELRTHLAAVEWAAADAAGAPAQAICPACRVLKPGPHSPGCFIARSLRTQR